MKLEEAIELGAIRITNKFLLRPLDYLEIREDKFYYNGTHQVTIFPLDKDHPHWDILEYRSVEL